MDTLIKLLQPAAQSIGFVLAILGVVQLGLTLKEGAGGGGQLSNALTMIVAGILIFGAAGWATKMG